ncbi:MAG: TetR/AcrR family transcriptional regulator [Chloroflexi bacterium]|nr:MAG: TetR/AcrR family transcriptional regulator [Chloroflexota bacterium]
MAKNNTRSEILQHSRDLFQEQGYSATTVRQIAKRTGCTAGSLYYFFEGGKPEILQEVIRSYGLDPVDKLSWVIEEKSLDDLIDRLINELPLYFQEVIKRLNWLQLNPAQLTDGEFKMMRKFPLSLFESIQKGVNLHIDNSQKSQQITWMIYCSLYGYVDVFNKIGTVVDASFDINEMGNTVRIAIDALVNHNAS